MNVTFRLPRRFIDQVLEHGVTIIIVEEDGPNNRIELSSGEQEALNTVHQQSLGQTGVPAMSTPQGDLPDWSQFYADLEDRSKSKLVVASSPAPEPAAPPVAPPYPWCLHPGTCIPLGYCPRPVSCGD